MLITSRQFLLVVAIVIISGLFCACQSATNKSAAKRLVRLAELEIDPAQLDNYKAALREEIDTSIRIEPGVLTLFAVSVKDHPNQIRLFETYADIAAYEAHLKTPHFRKYKAGTQAMVTSLRLIETDPILLGSK